ncbi:MAG: SprB repeat-containing protein [Saprospiraceae bacterium]|nr:SprB repeat-containing protein [Candidatus Opimibacter iunctus]
MKVPYIIIFLFVPSCLFSQVRLEKQDESCNGRKDGSIEVIVEGIEGPFNYEWRNTTKNLTLPFNSRKIIGLEPGDYAVTVSVRNGGCMATKVARIWPGKTVNLDLSARLLDVSPHPLGCGERPVFTYKLYALPHGGTPPYTCSWGAGGLGKPFSRTIK